MILVGGKCFRIFGLGFGIGFFSTRVLFRFLFLVRWVLFWDKSVFGEGVYVGGGDINFF